MAKFLCNLVLFLLEDVPRSQLFPGHIEVRYSLASHMSTPEFAIVTTSHYSLTRYAFMTQQTLVTVKKQKAVGL